MGAIKLAAVIAVLFVVAVINDWSAPDQLIITLLVVLGTSYLWSRLSLQRLGMSRSLSLDRVRAGEWVSEEIRISNFGRIPKLWLEIRDFSSLPNYQPGRVVNLGSRGAMQWTATTRCTRRGRFRLGPINVASGDPLGLFRVNKTVPVTHELVVYPVALDVSTVPLPAASMSGGKAVNRNAAIAAHTISGLREYASGDPLNRISWTATARTGTMMVKEFDPDPTSDLWILVDLNESHRHTVDPKLRWTVTSEGDAATFESAEEFAIALAGSISERCLAEGRKVGLIVNRAMPIRIDPDNSQRQWFRIFETLAVATSFGHRSLSEAISAEARRFSRNSGLIVITASPDRDWVMVAGALVQRQVPVTAVVVDESETQSSEEMRQLIEALAAAHVALAVFHRDQNLRLVDRTGAAHVA